jgi:hypothetical protein
MCKNHFLVDQWNEIYWMKCMKDNIMQNIKRNNKIEMQKLLGLVYDLCPQDKPKWLHFAIISLSDI